MNRVPQERMRLDIGVSTEAYDETQKLESVHRLPHHENLLNLYRVLFDSDVLVHPPSYRPDDHGAPKHGSDAASPGLSFDLGNY